MATNVNDSGLWQASKEGDAAMIACYLAKGQDIHVSDDNGWTALHFASTEEVAEALLTNGADAEARTRQGETPLHVAIRGDVISVVTTLLRHGASVNRSTRNGDAPLHIAVIQGLVDVTGVLLDRGAECNVKNILQSATPLHLAVNFRKSKVVAEKLVQLLLAKGADANASNKDGYTPLLLVARKEEENVNMVRYLIKAGADIEKVGSNRQERALEQAICHGHEDIVAELLRAGAATNISGATNGETPLHLAAQRGFVGIVQLLHDHGARLDSVTCGGLTQPLHYAVTRGSPCTVAQLLKLGADANAANRRGERPLHLAVAGGHLDIVRLLVEDGASVDAPNHIGQSPLEVARLDQKVELVALMNGRSQLDENVVTQHSDSHVMENSKTLSDDQDNSETNLSVVEHDDEQVDINFPVVLTPLHNAVLKGQTEVVQQLLDEGVPVESGAPGGWTPLHVAVASGHLDIILLLLNSGADVRTITPHGGQSLHLALEHQQLHVLPLLQEFGAHEPTEGLLPLFTTWCALREKGENFYSAVWENCLLESVRHGWTPLVGFLLVQDVDVEVPDTKRRTSLHLAAGRGYTDIVGLLLEYGADVNALDFNGNLPLHNACHAGYADIVRLLVVGGGADVEAEDKEGWRPVHLASQLGHTDVVRVLVAESGAKLNRLTVGSPQFTPLHWAAFNGHVTIVKLLLFHGADVDTASGTWSDTPLHLVAAKGRTDVAVLLLAAGASTEMINTQGRTAYQVALLHENTDVAQLLQEKSPASDSIARTSMIDNLSVDEPLPSEINNNGSTATI